ncbi:unnamed protein product [Arabidopsis thaliana]|uniref:Uncharacterized protein n=2 Tax=Arabidopsis thaliana TaxID=3702 RepID=A0A178VIW1_ARATH|nr:hypothetical protein AXX17_AT3G47130 [Arabidopsis thaliana]VYS60201.1 unnamed protein product [Arabidopsis thaliana]
MLAVFTKSVAGVKLFGMMYPVLERSENLPTDDSIDAIKEIAKALQSVLFKLHINGYSSLLHPLGVNNVDFILKFYVVKDGENDSLRVINVYHKLCGEAEDSWLEIVNNFRGEFSFISMMQRIEASLLLMNDYNFGTGGSVCYVHILGGHYLASGKGLRKLQLPLMETKMEPLIPDDIV